MFTIINTKTGRFVFGTDYRHCPPHQRTSVDEMMTFPNTRFAELAMEIRRCGKDYAVAELEPVKIKRIIPRKDDE